MSKIITIKKGQLDQLIENKINSILTEGTGKYEVYKYNA